MGTKETTLASHTTKDRIQDLMTTFKCINGMAPKYVQDLISIKNKTQDNMCSNNTGTILHTPKVKYQTIAAWSFRYSAPTLWNQLPKVIKVSPNLDTSGRS